MHRGADFVLTKYRTHFPGYGSVVWRAEVWTLKKSSRQFLTDFFDSLPESVARSWWVRRGQGPYSSHKISVKVDDLESIERRLRYAARKHGLTFRVVTVG